MIKLIVSDIDGTLLPDGGHELNPEFFEVIGKLRDRGMQFAAASGRQWVSIDTVFAPIKERIFYLSDNGAYVGCAARRLFVNTIDRVLAMDLVRDIRAEGLEVLVGGPDMVYLESRDEAFCDWLINGYKFRVKRVADVTEIEDDIIKVTAYRKNDVEHATKSLRDKYGDRLKMVIAGEMWMDCMAPGVSKGQAVKLLQDSLGILPEETIAFGDQLNDLDMLKQAYYSFAVANARPEVKAAARFEADANTRDGVLKILKLLL